MFWFLGQEACGIIAPWSGMESTPLALEGKAPASGPPGKSHLNSSLSVTSYLLSVLRKSPSPHFFTCSMQVTSSTYITGMLRRLKGVIGVHAQPLPGTSTRHMRVHKIIYIQCAVLSAKSYDLPTIPPLLWRPVLQPSKGGVCFSLSWIWAALWFALIKWSDIVPIPAQAWRDLVAPTFGPWEASHHAKLEPNSNVREETEAGDRLGGGDEVQYQGCRRTREADLEAPDPVQPTELWEISYCYFKPVSFGFISYTAINWNLCTEEKGHHWDNKDFLWSHLKIGILDSRNMET